MVASMRHWSTFSGIIADSEDGQGFMTAPLGDLIFSGGGYDPYMETPSTLWLVHWQLTGRPDKTTWFWAFNAFSGLFFERETLVSGLEKLAAQQGWSRVATATLRRDVECFVRTYVARPASGQASHDDALESPLAELGLIKPVGKRDGFRFVRGPKPTLGQGVFAYALLDFWECTTQSNTLSFEMIAQAPGSPGRVFLLDENDVADRLVDIEDATKGLLKWSETAGLKQVLRKPGANADDAIGFIALDYQARKEAA
eukprot:Cvel_2795.t1-p1 / transcript=Cvel_2795.t1 / gene=Cvel_2795 / organism=Chromera_velia_CCMP2878 / gene_product=hypothetical protein / transcript_product=hypothetical protein / location=Cvel_scaffold113:6730-7494(+) / protein_length=255 / sequence_SO=supercontig / SO=protein_coding / is_pseudo=false